MQFGRPVAAEVGDGVDFHAVVQDRFQEGVGAELLGYRDGEGAAVDDVAYLARVGVAASPGVQVAHDDQLRAVSAAGRRAAAGGEGGEGVGGVGLEPFGRAAGLAGGPAGPVGGHLDPATRGRPVSGGRAPVKHTMPRRSRQWRKWRACCCWRCRSSTSV